MSHLHLRAARAVGPCDNKYALHDGAVLDCCRLLRGTSYHHFFIYRQIQAFADVIKPIFVQR